MNLKINSQKLSNLKNREEKTGGDPSREDLRKLWVNKFNIHIIGAPEGKESK